MTQGPPFKGKIRDLTDIQLRQEREYWKQKIEEASAWGGAVAAAIEFFRDCESEIRRRNAQTK